MILVDTGVLLAAADNSESLHTACSEVLVQNSGQLGIPTPVVVEASWLIGDRLGATSEARFLRSVQEGELRRIDLDEGDWARAIELVEQYADLGLGLVDASLVTADERLGVRTLATLNRRDFSVVRPRHVAAFELIP